MGVLECDRNGCVSIMCEWYSGEFGYLCNDCHTELVEKGGDILEFMESEKGGKYSDIDISHIEREFKLRL